MRVLAQLSVATVAAGIALIPQAEAQRTGYSITPVPFTSVTVNDAFWRPRIETNRAVTIPYALRLCDETGRIRNFALADSVQSNLLSSAAFCSRYGFDDSDVYKIIEGASYALHTRPDAALDAQLDRLIAVIGRAQEPDGYLYTMKTMRSERTWVKERWVNDRVKGSHELYNAGHLYEAAVAHYAATGKRTLLDIALRNADLLCATFGPDKMHTVPGHQVVEIGLARLYLVTGKKAYLDLAKFFLDERGKPPGETYNQDHLPVVEQREAVGHAVRAGYMYSGMADVAALTGDDSYVRAIDRIWEDVVGTKLYLTGGVGAAGNIEGFGAAYELPNLSAYCETCASIANIYWNERMFFRHGDGKYLDVVERTLYNAFLSGVGMSGDRFFYPNVLEAFRSGERSPWFACACCPSNIVRFVPSIPGYIYAVRGESLYVNLFIGSEAKANLGRTTVAVRQETRYPWEGRVRIFVDPRSPEQFTIGVRVPGWAQGKPVPSDLYRYEDGSGLALHVTINGNALAYEVSKGFLYLRRQWSPGDVIDVEFPMPVRRVLAHDKVADDRGKASFERGPLVFCLEGQDQPRGEVLNLVIPDGTSLATAFQPGLLGGVQVITGTASATKRTLAGGIEVERGTPFTAIPYYAWAHRGPSQMTVWPARLVDAAKPRSAPTLAATSTVTSSGGETPDAVADQLAPATSADQSYPYLHWWPKKGTVEWVQYDLKQASTIRKASVFWYDDSGRGECRVPASWRLLARRGDAWVPLAVDASYGCSKDAWNGVTFAPVTTDAIRLEVRLQDGWSAGIHEWVVE